MQVLPPDHPDFAKYFDLSFRSETRAEVEFIEAACRKYCTIRVRRLLELGCGGGRLVVALAARGYQVVGLDHNRAALDYLRERLRRRRLHARLLHADMARFQLPQPVDAAFCTFNTFRHLTTEGDARTHLHCVAKSLRAGGIYLLGFHLLPADAAEECQERWSARHGRTRVTATLRVLTADRQQRLEMLRLQLRVRTPARDVQFRSEFPLRMYTLAQFERLLASVRAFELCDVYDFWYEINQPRKLNEQMTDTVFVLRRRT